MIFGTFNLGVLKNWCALCWYFVFSLFSFLFNLSYDCFSLFLLRVIFLAYHVFFLAKQVSFFGIFLPIRLLILFQKRALCLYYTSCQSFHLIFCFQTWLIVVAKFLKFDLAALISWIFLILRYSLYVIIMSPTSFRVNPHSIVCLNVKELLAWSRRSIWSLSDSNGIQTHNHLIRKQTLNHLAK